MKLSSSFVAEMAVAFAFSMEPALAAQNAAPAPSVQSIYALHKLPEPLVPSGGEPTSSDNEKLMAALAAFEARQKPDDFSALERFIAGNPKSPWLLAVETNLGLLYYHAGYFSKCIPAYLDAWKSGKDATDGKAKALADRAAGEYTKMLARLGRYDDLKAFLKEVGDRKFGGHATELMMAGLEGSTTMEKRPEIAFRCGPLALSRILASQGSPLWASKEIMESKSTMRGMSLAEVADLSAKLGMNYQPAKRSPGAPLILPSVIHWKVGHYAALIKKEGTRYLTQDPTFENETWHTLEALEAEASGYFLIPSGPLPAGWSAVGAEEAKQVFGKGTNGGGDGTCTKPSDEFVLLNVTPREPLTDQFWEWKVRQSRYEERRFKEWKERQEQEQDRKWAEQVKAREEQMKEREAEKEAEQERARERAARDEARAKEAEKRAREKDPEFYEMMDRIDQRIKESEAARESKHMAISAFHTMLASLTIKDTPVGYDPPYGCPVWFTVTYTQRETSQPSNFNYCNLGQKWNFNWQDYISDDPENTSVATRGVGGGGSEIFSGFNSTSEQFAPQFDSNAVLTRTSSSPIGYTLTNPDGSKLVYAQSDGSSVSPRKVFLSQCIDPAGNVTTVNYDGQLRITSITDAVGRQTIVSYELGSDPYKITKVTDPFGRSASFSYDGSGRLTTIQDPIGIQSIFTYDGAGNFLNSLTTPYGTSTFSTTEDGSIRRLTATNPAGETAVLETNNNLSSMVPASDPAAAVPQNMLVTNNYLNYRNSFYWNRKQWKDAPNDYSKAHLYHWLHGVNPAQMSGYLESERPPLEARIWYGYPGQSVGQVVGQQVVPNAVGRVVEGGSQVSRQNPNILGHPLSRLDPLGRTVTYTYDANYIDVLTVARGPGAGAVVGTYTWNAQHRPLTYTDAAGETTHYAWNNAGQITSVTNAKNEITLYSYYAADAPGKRRNGQLYQIDEALPGNSDVTTWDYDAAGRVASVTGPDGYFVSFAYDVLDRLTRVTYPDSTYTETTFLALDPQTTRDRLGRITTYVYDSLRQLRSETDPASRTVSYTWSRSGHLDQIIDAMGRATAWDQDLAGRVTARRYADGTFVNYAYQAQSGRLQSVTDERGQVKTFGYNLDDALATITYTNAVNSTPNVAFSYDTDFPRLKSMADGTGTTTYGYYPYVSGTLGAGRRSTETGPLANAGLTYTYDKLGRRTSYAVNGSGESRSFDAIGRISTMVNPLGTFGYTYVGATDRMDTVTYPSGMSCAYAYQPLAGDFRLKDITHTLPGNTLLSKHSYAIDVVGRITRWTQLSPAASLNRSWLCGYDDADQLASVASQDPATFTNLPAGQYGYTHDPAGNRLSETLDGSTTTAGHNILNQLGTLTDSGVSTVPAQTHEWDAENRLTAINYTGTNQRTEMQYDGYGRRVRVTEKQGGVVTADRRFVWSGSRLLEERDTTGQVVQKRYFGRGMQTIQAGGALAPRFFARDHLGSVRSILDASNSIIAAYDYDPWGRRSLVGSGTEECALAFTGYWWHDASGLAMTLRGSYHPSLGRWLSRDPFGESDGPNLYTYGNSDPMR